MSLMHKKISNSQFKFHWTLDIEPILHISNIILQSSKTFKQKKKNPTDIFNLKKTDSKIKTNCKKSTTDTIFNEV